MTNYDSYNESDLHLILNEPWEISDRPYMLHAAYALSCLYEAVAPIDDEDEEAFGRDDIWGCSVPKKILDRLVVNISESFNNAADNEKRVDIWGRQYSIRKRNAYDHKRLHLIFDFPLENEEYTITKDGIKNLSGPVPDMLQKYELTQEEARANRLYLRQVIMLAEDDANNGWDKLTDMEVAMYCWALYYHKYQSENLVEFLKLYKDYIYIKVEEIKSCLTEKAQLRERPVGMYTFSKRKVENWNKNARQESFASKIQESAATDYWYEVALKKTFKEATV